MLGIIVNWGRWSDMVVVKLLDIMSGSIKFENKLPISHGTSIYKETIPQNFHFQDQWDCEL